MAARAFTLTEILTAMAIFLMVVLGVVTLQIFGLQMNAISAGRLRSAASSLKVLDQVRDPVLGANSAVVGNGSGSSFTVTGTTGNALQVYPGTNTANYLRFYVATNLDALYELNSTNNDLLLIATNVFNPSVFETVNFLGNVSSSSQEHYSIRMTLQFTQLEFTIPAKGYDYYTLETEMTPRNQ
jgi:prepilin-type N-terminal cleavage/methylation domain-containing protein